MIFIKKSPTLPENIDPLVEQVLVVDDEAAERDKVVDVFCNTFKFEHIHQASDTEEAQAIIDDKAISIIILDMHHGLSAKSVNGIRQNGMNLLQKLYDDKKTDKMSVCVYTRLSSVAMHEQSRALGAIDTIFKKDDESPRKNKSALIDDFSKFFSKMSLHKARRP